jgi:hypothetical protein
MNICEYGPALSAHMVGLALAVVFMAWTGGASAAPPTCPDSAYEHPVAVPAELVPRVAKAFELDDAVVRDASYIRCDGDRLLACVVGANLNCFMADTRRSLPGATAWCRDHPGCGTIPMYATGHGTVYAWSCKGDRAIAGKRVAVVDARGYLADNWKPVR